MPLLSGPNNFATGGRWHIRSRAEDTGRFRPGRPSFQRRLELRRNLRSDSDAVADACRIHDLGFSQVAYPNILIGRVAKAVENGLHRLAKLAAGQHNAFKDGEQEMDLKGLADALDLQKWKELESKYLQP